MSQRQGTASEARFQMSRDGSLLLVAPLVIEQPLLPPQSAAVTAKCAIGADDAMTRDDDANHVRAVRAANSPARIYIAEAFRHP